MSQNPLRYHDFAPFWRSLIEQGLEDDQWQWDWTSLGTVQEPHKSIEAKVIAKSPGIWAGEGLVEAFRVVSQKHGMPVESRSLCRDGKLLSKGMEVAKFKGPGRMLLALERPFLNLTAYVCGIAWLTHQMNTAIVSEAKKKKLKNPPRLTSTRKTLPGYRDLCVYGVLVGGGFSHRFSLSGGVLIKENHIEAAGGIEKSITGVRKIAPHGLKIEIEVKDLKELELAIRAGAEFVLLDNFKPSQVDQAIKLIRKSSKQVGVEVSGGIDLETVRDYVIDGVDIISCGSLTHSAKQIDLSMLVTHA